MFFTWSYFADLKASVLLVEFSVIPGGVALTALWSALGLSRPPFDSGSWFNSVVSYYVVSLAISYIFGWLLSLLVSIVIGLVGGTLDRWDARLVERLDEREDRAGRGD